ncbi:ABC transporter substrate-binding protein [bacterium]|nr:ABC transporter substrate-binding protein [bacterium]
MKKPVNFIAILLVTFLLIPVVGFSQGKVIQMASLDWPPYTGESLPDAGANVVVAKAAFAAMGYELDVKFYPWARTIALAKTPKYVGYFPEYYAKEIESEFIFSDPIGDSPLGFVERTDTPIAWNTVDDLKLVGSIGTVRGYVNTEEFDQMAASGEIKVDEVVDDTTNLRKLLGKRIKMAVIDKSVMLYILKFDTDFTGKQSQLQFNSRLLENKKLYLCFQRTDNGKRIVGIFNEGLKKIDQDQITKDYFSKMLD